MIATSSPTTGPPLFAGAVCMTGGGVIALAIGAFIRGAAPIGAPIGGGEPIGGLEPIGGPEPIGGFEPIGGDIGGGDIGIGDIAKAEAENVAGAGDVGGPDIGSGDAANAEGGDAA